MRWLAVAGGVAMVLLALVVLTVLAAQPRRRAVAKPAPTATATVAPTATPTAMPTAAPSPTPLPGFAFFSTPASAGPASGPGFVIEYPAKWETRPFGNIGEEFAHTDPLDANLSFIVQVSYPDANNVPVSSGEDAASVAASWVDYEMGSLQQIYGASQFQRTPGPFPPVSIGGQMWQTGIAEIGSGDTANRVQVYATVYNGDPYVINVLAPDEFFQQGEDQYFGPMLATFRFLYPAP